MNIINLQTLGYRWAGCDTENHSWIAILDPNGKVARCGGIAALMPAPKRLPRPEEASLTKVMLRDLSKIAAGHAVKEQP